MVSRQGLGWSAVLLLLAADSVAADGVLEGRPAAPAPDCAVLERLAGTWIGRGRLRRHAVSGAEPIRCRLDSDWDGDRREVASRLDCRGVDGDLTFHGSIAAIGAEGRVSGVLEGSQGLDQGVMSGWCAADDVRLELSGRGLTTGEPVTATLLFALSDTDETLLNAMEALDPDSGEWFSALEVRFER